MLPSIKISIVPRCNQLSLAEAAAGAAAIQQQVIDHFAPVWKISAVVTALERPEVGYVPVFVIDNITVPGLTGYHTVDDGSPYAVVQYGATWTLAASHECLEMILDPSADRRVSAPLPSQTPKTVDFILEVCDPCQSKDCAYLIGRFLVSDFYTPNYFDSNATPGIYYSYNRKLIMPKEVQPGGTLAWIDTDSHAYQLTNQGGSVNIRDCGIFKPGPMAAREFMYRFDQSHLELSHATADPTIAGDLHIHCMACEVANKSHCAKYEKDLCAKGLTTRRKKPGSKRHKRTTKEKEKG
ncbi:MAG: hypothetical protein KAY79_02135 [Nitrospira sp.]|nr:hypothetical protein [Nitrospira sp.]